MLNVTTIKLYNDSLYPSQPTGGSLDCSDTTVIPLNFAISDIRDISKKKGVFSKSITLPSTKNNNKLLNNYFDINIQAGTFDINKLQKCAVVQDGVTILDNAILQLVSINKSQNNSTLEDSITYTVLIKDATSDFFTTISNKYLNNINMDDLNHIYTANNVISSFGNTVVNGYKYVMPYNQAYEDDANFELIEFTPAIYAKKYFDKIFSGAGYTYEWTSMTQSDFRFDKLLVPYNGDVVRTTSEESSLYSVNAHATMSTLVFTSATQEFEQNGYNSWFVMGPGQAIIALNIEDSDPSGSYSPTTYLFTTPNLPSVSNFVTYELTFNYSISGTLEPEFSNGTYAFEILLAEQINTIYGDQTGTIYDIAPVANGPGNNGFITSGVKKVILKTSGLEPNIKLGVFGSVAIYDNYNGGGWGNSNAPSFYDVEITNPVVKITTSLDGDVSYNTPLRMNKFIPQNIKQSDFVKSILTMYNLYVEVDKTVNNKLIIRSRDEYYDSGIVRNWTKKLVKEKEQDIKFIPEITNKKAILTYKEDSDWANTQYKMATNEVYGQAEYIFDNEYVKDITKTELIFSPTPFFNNTFGAICPIWNGQGPKTNIRILYDGGTFSCGKYYIYNYGTASFATASYYPLISHWDKPTNPTFDLNFLPCDFYFRNDDWGSNTNNNLFNLHWRRTFNQINSGKLLSAYFTLTPYDISILKLNDKIRIDNSWWNINSIKDYDANSKGPTKVELISIDELLKIPFRTVSTKRLLPSSPLFGFNEVLNNDLIRTKNFIRSKGTMKVSGRNNYVSNNVLSAEIIGNGNSVSTNSVVKGSGNTINSKNAMVLGSNNNVGATIKNSIVIGDGITATQSNTLYTDNIIMSPSGTINGYNVINSVSLWEPNVTGIGSVQQIVAPGSLPNTATGDNSTATGVRNNTSGVASFSSGYNNNSLGNYSSTLNNGNTATGQSSIASGANNNSVGNISSTFGNDNTANSVAETVIGTYAELVTGTPATFVATDTVFRVGIGQNTGARLDAFRIYKNSAIKLNPVTTASITTPITGMTIYNSTNNTLNIYNGSSWTNTNGVPLIKKYVAKIKCSTTAATILHNTLGGTPTIAYVAQSGTIPAVLTLTLTGAFTTGKTIITWTAATDTGTLDVMAGYVDNMTNNYVSVNFRSLNGTDYTSSLVIHFDITIYP